MKIYIFDIKIDTANKKFNGYKLDEKLDYVATQAKNIANAIAKVKGALAVLVAPEYFFAKYYPDLKGALEGKPDAIQTLSRYHSENEYNKIIDFFCKLSADKLFSNILFVPGTISWGKMPDHSTISVADAITAGGAPVSNDTPFFQAGLSMRSSSHSHNRGGQFALKVAEVAKKLKLPGTRCYLDYLDALARIKTILVYNSACFFYQGQLVHRYDKQCSFQEVISIAGKNEVDPPGYRAPVFRLDLNESGKFIVIGVEICFDHQFDVLEKFCKEKGYTGNKAPHLHFLLSAYTQHNYCYVQNNGLFVHSSSHGAVRAAFTQNDNRIEGLKNRQHRELSYYVSTIKISPPRARVSHHNREREDYEHPLGVGMFLPRERYMDRGAREHTSHDAFGRINPGTIPPRFDGH